MSYTESPVETFKKFARTDGWMLSSTEVLASDFLSISNETNLLWDSGWYDSLNGKLIDPVTGRLVEETVGSGTDLDKTEGDVICELQEWFKNNDAGIALWISPKKENYYPGEKLSIYRIAYKFGGEKVLLRAHYLFEAELKNPEDMRKIIFTHEDQEENIFKIISFINRVSKKTVNLEKDNVEERKKLASYYAKQFISGVPIENIINDMSKNGFLGENPISCGASPSSNSLASSDSNFNFSMHGESEGWHSGTCRICGISTWVGPCSICQPCAGRL